MEDPVKTFLVIINATARHSSVEGSAIKVHFLDLETETPNPRFNNNLHFHGYNPVKKKQG